jgi:hypothetical protein
MLIPTLAAREHRLDDVRQKYKRSIRFFRVLSEWKKSKSSAASTYVFAIDASIAVLRKFHQ